MSTLEQSLSQFRALPKPESSRLIDFEEAEIRPGIVSDTYILIVRGTKPYLNLEVNLVPLVYVQQPEYWGIEVVGTLPGIGLPATAPYTVSLPVDGIRGKQGIEVIGANCSKQLPFLDVKHS
ncbi:hypothetical protein A6769_05240 [Nostoc punctiforme NIES-2108]|uniref:Uncharacterized protein n=1 Tax=Nostoc punctiforme NIES-2108 TaxID=1356359 RepID=A0A367RVU7_NOSPU|nr:hypothetical protein A6769_05240 [Nostoc punctiforme NIES-2108]